jgi:CMP-N,N'-diacetyllegionaminic acid synthase
VNNTLFIIPARGGSKGIHQKNIKPLNGKPLIYYSIDAARKATDDQHICVSTDDDEFIHLVEAYGLKVPFKRPAEFSTDTSSSEEVIKHALNYYKSIGVLYKNIVLLQPTSPLRNGKHIKEALNSYSDDLDMVVSVKETNSNPYYVLFEENDAGFLEKSKKGTFTRRQDCPKVWEYNGAIYVINTSSLEKKTIGTFTKVKKYEMDKFSSIDIDDVIDWKFTEFIMQQELV